MAPRRGAAVEEGSDDGNATEGLKFNEPLSWKAGKPIPTGELVRRLDKLSRELADLEQEWPHKDSLNKVAKELCSHQILGHKDKGVRAFAACCLVDILKICAPDAPFSPAQLKDIFSLFITYILPALQDPTHTYNVQHKYVLVSLSEVKSVLLLDELPNNEALFIHLFTCFFDSVSGAKAASGEQVGKDVEYHMTEILVALVDEAQTLPTKVVDIILAQFLRAAAPGSTKEKKEQAAVEENQSTLLLKEEPPAYQMAKTVCNTCPERMARYIGQYFTEVIMEASGIGGRTNGHRDRDDSDDEETVGPSEADLKDLRKAHLLMRELWKAAPGVLQSVIPQLDTELSADNVNVRQLATETLGDIISGIGAAGAPPPPALDPAAYPPPRLADELTDAPTANPLTTPYSPINFALTHPAAYQSFVGRKNDKSAVIRAAWTTAVGYILSTNAGGIGLTHEDEGNLVRALAEKLNDSDEKVRLAGVKAVESFTFRDVVLKLAPNGGVDKQGSVLGSLADRCLDRKPHVRVEAMALMGRLWAVATGELAAGNETVAATLSGIPSVICKAFYKNDQELNLLIDRVIFEYLVPLSFPPPPKKGSKGANGTSQSQSQSQLQAAAGSYDPDVIRAERILLLIGSLDQPAKRAFFAMQSRQPQFAAILGRFIKACEDFNGGVMDEDADKKSDSLEKVIRYVIQFLPEAQKANTELHKFAKANDRRNYQLIKFVIGQEYDFKTVHRAIKELIKRLQGPQHIALMEFLVPLLYRSGYLMFNRSHLATILDYSRTDREGLGSTAHEILNEISQRSPDLFKTHIGDLCKDLVDQAPTKHKENDLAAVETLKACSSYSRKYPKEIPSDRAFIQTLMNYTLYGHPYKAAKYAVNILLAKTDDDQRIVNATELIQKVMKDFTYGSDHFPNKLAAIGQLELLAPKVTQDYEDAILHITFNDILKGSRTVASETDPDWVEDADLDEECLIKCLSLKLLVNRLRNLDRDDASVEDRVRVVFKLLKTLVKENGQMPKAAESPKHHKARLRLLAAQLILKLCKDKRLDEMFSAQDFNDLALVVQDANPQIRRRFMEKLQKYLGQGRLRPKFYTMVFLAAYEPNAEFKQRIETWIRSRVHYYEVTKQTVMEAIMARLISLIAHHPDYSPEPDELVDHARYILFYVSNVAKESNLGLIFRYAERVKQTRDAIDPENSENIYVLSDLAQAVIRKWQERKGWAFQAYGSKIGLPTGLYLALPSHQAAQEISEKQYIPNEIDEKLDDLLRSLDRKKKRKSMDDGAEGRPSIKKVKAPPRTAQPKAAKRAPKKAAPKTTKTPSRPKKAATASSPVESSERRRSGRSRKSHTYIERDSSEDDDEMLEGVAEWAYDDSDVEKPPEAEESEAEDSTPEPMDEDKDEPVSEKAAEDEESELSEPPEDIVEDEEEKEEPPPPPASNGRRATAANSKAKRKPAAKSAAKPAAKPEAPAAKAAPAKTSARATRAAKSRKAKDVYAMDEDDE
ncbi:Sister chromatid cohesion protein pds5 [Pleurostoma richardsiae]|uniref:Sister chromatid cohesion protein pds5 n=1 Tax=Pleurostoma richardsiae TaxID=41990 RepID=A0AA38S1D0_9PEZI|nr:Sister chromatid cohesion protein pds5 [Pleurostoma richardsiae]